MKRTSICAILATLVLVAGCQKDQDVVTLGIHTDNSSKMYIDNLTPAWDNGDQVYVNNDTYTVSNSTGSSASIQNVPVSTSGYCAVYPASLVTPGTNLTSGTVSITLPERQEYVYENGHQRVDMPMAAYVSSGTNLQFHNLCAILRLTVNNSTTSSFGVNSITITSTSAKLSGAFTATINGNDNDVIAPATGSSSVTLAKPDNSTMATIANGSSATFDIVLPAFSAQSININVETSNGFQQFTKSEARIDQNTLTPGSVYVDATTAIPTLITAYNFKRAMGSSTAVRFEYNVSNPSGSSSLNASGATIKGKVVDGVFVIATSAPYIYANANSSNLFSSKSDLTSIDFGEGFNTSNVTNMSSMFKGCTSLSSIDLSAFNTASVTNMSSMFSGCTNLNSITFPSTFNASSVTDMSSMFKDCTSLSSIDLSAFNTASLTNISSMFYGCTNLGSITFPSTFNTSNVTNMSTMFFNCSSLATIDVSHFSTSLVTNMTSMFNKCTALTSLDLSNFTTSSVRTMTNLFYLCNLLVTLNLTNWSFSALTGSTPTTNMFTNIGIGTTDNPTHCTITCDSDDESFLSSNTSLPSGTVINGITY